MNHATFIPKRESWTDIALAKVVLAEDADGAVVEQLGLQGFVFRGQTDERQKERKWGMNCAGMISLDAAKQVVECSESPRSTFCAGTASRSTPTNRTPTTLS